MKKSLFFLFLLFLIFFLSNQVRAETGICICEPEYEIETKHGSGDCYDTYKRVCETNCGGGCTSWEKTKNRWEVCETDEEGEEHCHCESETKCSISYEREYQCTDNCDGRLQERIHETGCNGGYTDWVDIREGFEWQKCDPDVPGFYCDGECIEAPQNLQEYQDPNSSIVADSPAKLPVKLDWDDVPGWQGGWSGGGGSNIQDFAECQRGYIDFCWQEARDLFEEYKETHPNAKWCQGEWTDEYLTCLRHESAENCQDILGEEECEEECPPTEECYKPDEFIQSYKLTITGDLRGCGGSPEHTFILETSEFLPPCHCFFKSNESYTWTVQACCGEDGAECGPPNSSSFTTSLAPEPISPEDPDWADSGQAEPTWKTPTVDDPYPVHLEWCSVDEAKSYCIRMYEEGAPLCPTLYSALFCPAVVPPDKDFPIQTYFDFGLDVFTKKLNYQWKISTCLGEDDVGQECGLSCPEDEICYTFETLASGDPGCCDFSQLWKFSGDVVLPTPELISPEDDGCVNLSHSLEWTHVPGANSYRYEIYLMGGGPSLLINEPIREEYIPIKDLWDIGILTIKENYGWRVKPCWDENGLNCEDDSWSNGGALWEFTTTGATPTGLDVTEKDPATGNALIPIKLNWDDVACAASYRYELEEQGVGIIATGTIAGLWPPASEVSIDYDSGTQPLRQDTDYLWRVKTCADIAGSDDFCGQWASGSFRTFILGAPQGPQPCDNCKFYTDEHYLRWDSVLGAAFYRYTLDGGAETIVPSNFVFIDTATLALGSHEWSVQPCLDKNCLAPGPPTSISTWHFELEEGESAGKGGVVPCGRYTDNPNTPWNEREHCGIKHFFIMIFAIIDFLLWKLIPIALALLTLASGIIFYFSGQLGITDPPSQVKSLWKAAGIGLAVVFLAWIGISLILGLFGYQAGLLGPWWKISF